MAHTLMLARRLHTGVAAFAVVAFLGGAPSVSAAPHRARTHRHVRGHCATKTHRHRARCGRAKRAHAARARVAVRARASVSITQQPGSPTSSTTASVAWSTTGPVLSTKCSVDGGTYAGCSSPMTLSRLSDGAHSVTVKVQGFNNTATATANWTVSTLSSQKDATSTTSTTSTSATTSTSSGTSVNNLFGRDMFGIAAGGAIQSEDPGTLAQDLDADQAAGSRWLRIDINWAQIQSGGSSSYDWAGIDALVSGAQARGMKVLGVILYTPDWARPSGTSATYGPDPNVYAAFARMAAAHYSALGVHAYEVWNEPNTAAFWTPAPNPSAYAQLLKAAYPAIKAADPGATVVTGGTAPAPTDGTNFGPVDWLSRLYAAGAGASFDAVGHHPYCWPAYPGEAQGWSAWYQMYGTSPSLRSVMVANGDSDKKIWATEFGAPTNGPGHVSYEAQASMVARAYDLWETYSWSGALFFFQGRDDPRAATPRERSFGLLRADFSPKAAYRALAGA